MSTSRTTVRRGFAVLAAAVVTATVGGVPPAQAGVNSDAGYLVVYDNNVENLLPADCKEGDYRKLIAYMNRQPKSPDVFTVQQVSNRAQLDRLTKELSDALPGTYAGVIALPNPGSMGYENKDRCTRLKTRQTNAIIYRTGRLVPLTKPLTWRSDAPRNHKNGGPCQNLFGNGRTSQDRVVNVALRFRDTVAKQDVTVASIHWPTGTWGGPDCAAENMKEANAAVDRLGGTLKIVAGDMNTSKGTKGWWNKATKSYKFRDPIAETCGKTCPDSTSTSGKRRIDYILVKSGHGFTSGRSTTISDKAAGGSYSAHKALTAYVKY